MLDEYRGGSRGWVLGVRTLPPPEMTCGFLIQPVLCKKKKNPLLKKILDLPLE